MAPPQSYLNPSNPQFSRYVNITDPTRPWHSEFHYFGSNVYSYILAKYGNHIDLVSIQLYESYSDGAMAVHHDGTSADDYLVEFVYNTTIRQKSKFYVDFSMDPTLFVEEQYVDFPLSKLVI